ncbi:phosphonate C-P lyase system protein PhnG [Peteryoungia desertarenae]|uniref:Phosphonate C-P lyase system protein PhnG n=1 Tax=Peteryoungia desertarenae TaxID=1813451 RepID=A0ABX6QKN8_9HYPH|nr:phosphonate C-P lyase system protein PhnG [Peteryoungia desertarenae]QLF69042.1 phosphonate C-P lyase system protein PhnG [Peteryoungia desertarenae]
MNPTPLSEHSALPERKRIIDLLARASKAELETALEHIQPSPEYSTLRGPETGLVMVRGRIGGGGSPFNLGEATMSRASVRLKDGTVGHGYRLGTDRRAVTLSAVFDALSQDESHRKVVGQTLLQVVSDRLTQEQKTRREETAATKVDFFTMVRGED